MKVAVLRFPGSNCDQDAYHALKDDLGIDADYVWHETSSLEGFDAVFVPGGFSYGDYLRCGAMASRSPVMDEVRRLAGEGAPVIGACNGFQILCEAGLLPGALVRNEEQKFLCQDVHLVAENHDSLWTKGVDRTIRIPIAHGEGRYVADEETVRRLEGEGRIAFRYQENPNGSTGSIAGVLNDRGNVLGLMPHPERATREVLGNVDGLTILQGLAILK
ncbi:phosphoribosylformylglycinamidine synthase subunit PurQ [bacterium]|nr:MAG: phosphoribosylformylglycinamidine synthase subunit PurQ [bacterium]